MDEATYVVPATIAFLLPWLQRYALDQQPSGIRYWEFVAGNVHNWGNVKRRKATLRGAPSGDVILPLVEVWVEERDASCDLRLRCNEPSLMSWFEGLRIAVVARWPQTPEAEASRGQSWAKDRVSDETRARAEATRVLHLQHPEWSYQDIADHLLEDLSDDDLSKLKRGFNRAANPLGSEDIENAWKRMGDVEGHDRWPRWGQHKRTLR